MRTATTTGMARVWRQKGEGLIYTGKGSKELAGGRRVHVMVAIAYGKGVILAKPNETMTGKFFADFIKTTLIHALHKQAQKTMGMDNDPCQSSKVAMKALEGIEAELLKIPDAITRPKPHRKYFPYCQM